MVEEEDGEELLGGAELVVGSVGWGNKRRRLPPVRCSWRKTTAEKTRGPASLAGAVGRILVQQERGDEALLLVQLDSSGWLIGDGQWWRSNGQCGAEQRGVRLNGCCQPKPTDGRRQAAREPGGSEPLSVGPTAHT
jgi:hypothetical protein